MPLAAPGPHRVDVRRAVLHDGSRNREVPITAYVPGLSPWSPLVLFSHGMGESCDSYEYLGRHWASHGYVVVHITHRGSDKSLLEEKGWLAIFRATRDPENWKNRPIDASFIIDRFAARDPLLADLCDRVDLSRIAAAGHSAGAYTAMVLAGTIIRGEFRQRDERITCAIALSLPRLDVVFLDGAYDEVEIPVLHLTGTRDRSLVYATLPRHRRVAWEQSKGRDQVLLTIRDATHWTFSNPTREDRPHELTMQGYVQAATRRFLDAFLRGDAGAKLWLTQSLPSLDGGAVNVESR